LIKEGENYQYLRRHILLGKRIDPKFSQGPELMLNQFFVSVMKSKGIEVNQQTGFESSKRLLDTLRSLCIAVARLKLKGTIDEEDANEVIEFYSKQLKHLSQVVDFLILVI
jgi:DNA replicative helicase MCM subunit Mcm2 (Cdc46/Mcm family)